MNGYNNNNEEINNMKTFNELLYKAIVSYYDSNYGKIPDDLYFDPYSDDPTEFWTSYDKFKEIVGIDDICEYEDYIEKKGYEYLGKDNYEINEDICKSKLLEWNEVEGNLYAVQFRSPRDTIDAILTARDGRKINCELKNRDILSSTHKTSIIELSKYNALMSEYNLFGYLPWYMVFYKDYTYVWMLNEFKAPKAIFMNCEKDTTVRKETNISNKVTKEVIHLEFQKAVKFNKYAIQY